MAMSAAFPLSLTIFLPPASTILSYLPFAVILAIITRFIDCTLAHAYRWPKGLAPRLLSIVCSTLIYLRGVITYMTTNQGAGVDDVMAPAHSAEDS